MTAADLQGLTWDAARVGGFVAYGLMLASVVIGLLLSAKVRSTRFPRVVTNELHRFVTLLALVFTVVHGLAVAIDPFIKLNPVELLVPFTSHFRPAWMAFGIVGFDLLVAIYLSERVRSRVGYAWWRRFHALAFVAYVLATLHGLGTGSDSRTMWAIALYAGGAILVIGLLLYRLRPMGAVAAWRRPAVMAITVLAAVAVAVWAGSGPLAPGWAAAAGGAAASTPTPSPAPVAAATPQAAPAVQRITLPFQSDLKGTAVQTSGAGATLTIDARLGGSVSGQLKVTIPLADDAGSAPMTLTVEPTGATCTGEITTARRGVLGGTCSLPDGRVLALQMRVGLDDAGALVGTLAVAGAAEPGVSQQN
jgi:DMSO/TMAO reductase YedYZ heme-binding membrane subunit